MKINGSLVFDASSSSEIQNLRVQKYAGNAVPTHTAADVGRLIYATSTAGSYTANTIYIGGASSWVPLATGGDAASMMAELDAFEAAFGDMIKSDGTFDATVFSGNLAGAATVKELFTKLQTALASEATARAAADTTLQGNIGTVASDLAAEVTRATGAESTLTTNLASEVTRATAAEATLTTGLSNEVTRAQAAEATLTTNLAAEVTRATAAEATLTTNLAAEVTRATAAEGVLQDNIGTEEAARIAGDATNATAISTEQTRATTAEGLLSDRITQEVSGRTAADDALAAALAAETSARTTADAAHTSAITAEVNRATAAEQALSNKIDSAVAGMTWEAPVDDHVVNHTAVDLVGKADGYRVVDTTDFKMYTVTGGVFDAGEALVDGAAFFNRTTDVPYVFNGTALVQFNGASGLDAGAGLSLTGNTLNIGSDGTIVVNADTIGVAQSVLNSITVVASDLAAEVTRATTAEQGLSGRIDTEHAHHVAGDAALQAAIDAEVARAEAAEAAEATARAAAVSAEATARAAADTVLQGNIDAEATRAQAAEAALTTAVSTEAAARAAADTTLTNNLAAEVTRATGVEVDLQDQVDAADDALADEVVRATAAEDALAAKIGKMYFLYSGASASSHTVTHNLGQKYCNVTVVDASNEVVIPQSISFTDANELVVTFNTSIVCKVIVMGLASA